MVNDNLFCHACNKEFSCGSSKNRHIKNVHRGTVENKRSIHIKCPLCPEKHKLPFVNHKDLIKHLNDLHDLIIKNSIFHFRNIEEFEVWRRLESKAVDYPLCRTIKNIKGNGVECRYYNCNRSDSTGFVSTCKKRKMKSGGSIKISGICPSRISVKIFKNGLVTVKFTETHVGHSDDQRRKRLTKKKQHLIGEQIAKVTHKKIIQNARMIKDNESELMNVVTRGDSVLGPLNATTSSEKDEIVEPSTSQNLKLFLEETHQSKKNDINLKRKREIKVNEIVNYLRDYLTNLDDKNFEEFEDIVKNIKIKMTPVHVK